MPAPAPARITWLPEARPRPRHVAVGEFDGVHLGHREVIRGADTVLTFEPHPRAVVAPAAAPKLLTPLDVKAELVGSLGVEELVVIPFDASFAAQSPEDFVTDVLVGHLHARQVSVGENFRFGHKARGDVALLESRTEFDTRVARLVEVEGEIVSSTHIRALLAAGEVDVAARFLGYPFELRGIVAHGDARGRTLGYPTANLVPDDAYVCPGHGVYACRAGVRDADGDGDGDAGAGADAQGWRWHKAATNVGVRPMFVTGRGLLVEAFLLDFEGDLYDRELRVQFVSRLRGEKRFDSVEALVEQMGRDVQHTSTLVSDEV